MSFNFLLGVNVLSLGVSFNFKNFHGIKSISKGFCILVRTAETSFFVNIKRNPVWYISLGEYKKLLIYIARKLNNIHNMCNLCSYYQCCSLYLHVY